METDGQRPEDPRRPDPIPASSLHELQPGADDRLRRNFLFAATGVSAALCLTFWLIGAGKETDRIEQTILPSLTALFSVLTFLVWRGQLRGAEIVLVGLGACVLLERIHFTTNEARPGLEPVLNTYELLIWFPSVYLFAFLLFDKRRALAVSLVLLGASLVIVRDWLVPGAGAIYRPDVTEFYVGQIGCILFIYTFSSLKERFLSTHQLALNLRSFAETDFLTGVSNRRALTQALEREIVRCRRHGGALALILLDLDHFKHVNDSFGHDEGDRALRRVALLMDRSRRQTDLFGRWGGEEFLLIAPNLDLASAHRAAERLRDLLETSGRNVRTPVTASFGVSEYQPGDEVASLVKRADQALIEAKEAGRNRVVARAA